MEFEQIVLLCKRAEAFEDANLVGFQRLKGDASSRQYFRLEFEGASASTAILMLLSQEKGPVYGGVVTLDQDDTFVLVQHELKTHGVGVPEIYLDARSDGALIVEDVGTVSLQSTFSYGADVNLSFRRAVDMIHSFQDMELAKESVILQRHMGYDEFLTESKRFLQYYAVPNNYSDARLASIEQSIEMLCKAVDKHPRVPCHRDFMSWNIHILPDGELVCIDFQDMLLGSYAYDIMTLLHDRDVDKQLGPQRVESLLSYFETGISNPHLFRAHYLEVMLQRDLRLAGQFTYLSEQKGTDFYVNFVPGCLGRISVASEKLYGEDLFLCE